MEYKIITKNVSDIKPDKNQPRKTFDEERLQQLAESILGNGLLNPIEIDENNIITDGERRWKAHKIAGIKTITCRIVKNKDKIEKLRRQLILTLQDEEIPTDEKFPAIVTLWNSLKTIDSTLSKEKFCKELGISVSYLAQAIDYCDYSEKEPELSKKIDPYIIVETRNLPEKERKEVLKEFEGTKEKRDKQSLMRELVKEKKEKIQMQKTLDEIKKTKDYSIKITNTEEQLEDLKEKISEQIHSVGKVISYFRYIRKTKLYVKDARYKEKFFKNLDGQIEKLEQYVKDLKNLKENLEFEIVKE